MPCIGVPGPPPQVLVSLKAIHSPCGGEHLLLAGGCQPQLGCNQSFASNRHPSYSFMNGL